MLELPTGDIESRDDVERLVRAFYEKAMADTMIGYLFTDVAHLDLEAHVPVITSFWETMLFDGVQTYGGGAFAPHARLHAKSELRGGHFRRWVQLWWETVDERFVGERAEAAKHHGQRVATAFQRRLATGPSELADAPIPVELLIREYGRPS